MQAVTEGTGDRGAQVVNIDPSTYLTDLINQGKERDREIARLTQALEEERARGKEREEKLKKLEQFEDLLDGEEFTYFTLPTLKTKHIWQNFRGRVAELFGTQNLTQRNLRAVLEACLEYAVRRGHWTAIKNEKFNNVSN